MYSCWVSSRSTDGDSRVARAGEAAASVRRRPTPSRKRPRCRHRRVSTPEPVLNHVDRPSEGSKSARKHQTECLRAWSRGDRGPVSQVGRSGLELTVSRAARRGHPQPRPRAACLSPLQDAEPRIAPLQPDSRRRAFVRRRLHGGRHRRCPGCARGGRYARRTVRRPHRADSPAQPEKQSLILTPRAARTTKATFDSVRPADPPTHTRRTQLTRSPPHSRVRLPNLPELCGRLRVVLDRLPWVSRPRTARREGDERAHARLASREHELVELFMRRDFRCDCGTEKMGAGSCCAITRRADAPPNRNSYDKSFKVRSVWRSGIVRGRRGCC